MKHPLIFWKTVLICLMLAGKTGTYADNYQPSYSTAGFYSLSNTGRTIYSMNPAWRFIKETSKERSNLDLMTKAGMSYPCPTA